VSRLTELIAQTKSKDVTLARELEREFKVLSSRLSFGLNFERHRPESVELPGRPIRKGDKVHILPPRGTTDNKKDPRIWRIKDFEGSDSQRKAKLDLLGAAEPESRLVAVEDLVVVAEFRDYIYPGLTSTGKIEHGGERPFHTVINGENFHALEALTFTHLGKIDVIYIDPPYNTGAKDWKYNNNYVEGDDLYRHSKWLAMMERRLLIAKQLLNPADSVLIVTIDEKEVHRLGILLEQIFPSNKAQMVSIVISPLGQERARELARVEEYAFFIFIGAASPAADEDDLLNEVEDLKSDKRTISVRWERLIRGGGDATRRKSPNLFYPVFIDPERKRIIEVGDALPLSTSRTSIVAPKGTVAVWPLRQTGDEGRWRCSPQYLRNLVGHGYARVGEYDKARDQWTISYLGEAQIARVEAGQIKVLARAESGELILGATTEHTPLKSIKTVWNRPAHRAGEYGTSLNRLFIPGRSFPYPKSLYAVEDALRIAVKTKRNAIILDFFAGSGTTAHAVMRLNKQDGGHRQSIAITNNEVAADEQKNLLKAGLRPGDPGWEQWGICDYITKPRILAAVTGKTSDGKEIKGSYKFTNEFPMSEGFEENVEFFTLTYETPIAVSHNRAFSRIAPLLWMRAGSCGRLIDKIPAQGWDLTDAYGVLTDLDRAKQFCDAVDASEAIRIVYIVTDDDRRFQSVARRLPASVEPVRLYESYLNNFKFSIGAE
jgi:adenine-specific DNA-methyltransferase